MVALKMIIIGTLGLMFYQDIKGRSVYAFLFPILALCCGYLYFKGTNIDAYVTNVLTNAFLVTFLVLVVFIYSRVKLKLQMTKTMGMGDILLFYVLGLSFSSMAFMVILIGAMVFALALHLLIKNNGETVPLAGYMSLFVMATYMLSWAGVVNNIYNSQRF